MRCSGLPAGGGVSHYNQKGCRVPPAGGFGGVPQLSPYFQLGEVCPAPGYATVNFNNLASTLPSEVACPKPRTGLMQNHVLSTVCPARQYHTLQSGRDLRTLTELAKQYKTRR